MLKFTEDDIIYKGEIRGPDNNIYMEIYFSKSDITNDCQDNLVIVTDADGAVVDDTSWKHIIDGDKIVDIREPQTSWYRAPTNIDVLQERFTENKREPLPTTQNVVTFATYMANGRIQLQQRSFVSPEGKPIGNPGKLSINGGLIKANETQKEALKREAEEELGVYISQEKDEYEFIGTVYDAKHGRCNHVYRINGYDTILEDYLVDDVISILTKPEGLGRNYLWREDLEAAIKAEMVTDISVAILEAFPDLYPPTLESQRLGGMDGLL